MQTAKNGQIARMKTPIPQSKQSSRFSDCARALGADEIDSALKEKLAVVARQKVKADPAISSPDRQDEDIREALLASPAAHAKFAALPPSHQNEYLKWVGEAKKAPTRARRIAGMIEKLRG